MMQRLLTGLLCAVALLLAAPLRAEERIHEYQVDIELAEEGILDVREQILIRAENHQIVHGINREIPLAFIAADGHQARSFLKVLSVERDGIVESYEIIPTARGVVLRIGRGDVELTPDEYLYEIHYQVNRVITHAEAFDRLVWNVNGNEGSFAIDALSVRLALPEGTKPLSVNAHTGRSGERGKAAKVKAYGNTVEFHATRPYAPGENMTLDVMLPKGAIQPPDEATLREWEYADRASTISGSLTVLGSALLAFLLWWLFGRDPRRGVVVPQWHPPGGMSPGRVNYIASRNFDNGFWTAFSASLIDLAVKGRLVLEDLVDGITVRKTSEPEDTASLPPEQAAILRGLPPVGQGLRFNIENAPTTRQLGDAFSDAIVTDIGLKYYRPRRWVWISFTLLMLFVLIVHEMRFTAGVEYLDGWIPDHWASALFAWFFSFMAIRKWRNLQLFPRRASGRERLSILLNLLAASAIVLGLVLLIYDDAPVSRDGFLLAYALAMISTALAACIGRLSRKGREVMDGIEGLRLYLEMAEKDRMALVDAPTMTPAHYETLLPYAVALGVEQAWARHFEAALAGAQADDAQTYEPPWYSGSGAGTFGRMEEISAFSSRMASDIVQSLPSESDAQDSGWTSSSGSGRGGGGVSGW